MKDKIAIITGGAQGIGKAMARRFLLAKMRVVIADWDEEASSETQRELDDLGEIAAYPTDVSQESAVSNMVGKSVARFGAIDALVNNAGFMVSRPVENLSLEDWNAVIGTDLTGAFLCAKHCAPHLHSSKGAIVNISSTRALMSEPNTESYSAAKAGLVGLTHALAVSLGPDVRVNCISPGWIDTSVWKKSSARNPAPLSEADHRQHPCGRVGMPDDIAALALHLISPEAGFITGQNFVVDGGMTRKMTYV